MKNDNVYHPLFRNYVSRRLQDNIHPEKLLNLANHMEKDERTLFLSKGVNRRVVDSILLKNESFDQFYFMNRHDTRKENHILNTFLENYTDNSGSNSFELLEKISPYIGIDKFTLILKVMEYGEYRSFRNLTMMEKMPVEEQHSLIIRSLEIHSPQFMKLLEWARPAARNHISGLLIQNGDNDQFATALRNTLIPITELESCYTLSQFLEAHTDDIPVTLARLYTRAEQEYRWEYLLLLGANKNKKELLRSIVKSKDQKLIDRFFSIYKNSPEVKHLVPFM
jgi:hypothetical protein